MHANSHPMLCIECTLHVHVSNKMNNDTIALPGFTNVGCLVSPIFLLMDQFLFSKNNEENLSIRNLNFFAKSTIKFHSVYHSVWQFQMWKHWQHLELLTKWNHLYKMLLAIVCLRVDSS